LLIFPGQFYKVNITVIPGQNHFTSPTVKLVLE